MVEHVAKYQKYAEYQDSGVEWVDKLPANWSYVHLKWISTIYAGGTPSKTIESYWENGVIPWINSGAVNQKYVLEPSTYISNAAYENSSAKWIPKKALVMALAGQGKTKGMVAQLGIDTTCNQSMAAILPNDLSYARFLFWWITANYQNVRNMSGGDLRDGLNLEHLGDIGCPVPSSEEVKIITNFLDHETAKIDTLIAKQEKLIELLKEKRQAVISHAVTKGLNPNVKMKDSGVEWLGEVPEDWIVTKLSYVANGFNGDRGSNYPSGEDFIDEGIPFISTSDLIGGKVLTNDVSKITEDRYNLLGGIKIKYGDIIYCLRGSVGKNGICEFNEGTIASALMGIRCNSINPYYLLLLLNSSIESQQRANYTTGSVSANLSAENVMSYKFAFPPEKEQLLMVENIKRVFEYFDQLITKAESTIQLMQERRTALISSAVTGKIDVRNWQNPNKNNAVNMEFSA